MQWNETTTCKPWYSGRSRISRRGGGGVHPLGKGGVDLRHGHFLVKMYVKTKELGPMGGGGARLP